VDWTLLVHGSAYRLCYYVNVTNQQARTTCGLLAVTLCTKHQSSCHCVSPQAQRVKYST